MRQRLVSLDAVEITVIDEADHMADLGFLPAVTRILAATPAGGQRLLFSATLDNGVDKLVKRFLRTRCRTRWTRRFAGRRDDPPRLRGRGPEAKKDLVHPRLGHRPPHPVHAHQASGPQARETADRSGIPAVDLHGNLSQPRATATWPPSPPGRRGCWWPRSRRPRCARRRRRTRGACRPARSSTRPTCTAPAARPARAAPATSSPWCCPSSADKAALLRKAAITVRPQPVTADPGRFRPHRRDRPTGRRRAGPPELRHCEDWRIPPSSKPRCPQKKSCGSLEFRAHPVAEITSSAGRLVPRSIGDGCRVPKLVLP